MKCPYCGAENKSRVVDTTRDSQGGIRRRRECKKCERRFSTYERVLRATPLLIKGNGDREAFDREKLVRGIQISCAKRPIPAADINALVDRIETYLQNMGKDEVSSRVVGDMVIEGLKEIDPIAYIRYAIVYLGLDNLGSVKEVLDNLLAEQGNTVTTAGARAASSGKASSGAEAADSASTRNGASGQPAADKPEPAAADPAAGNAPQTGTGTEDTAS